MQTNADLAQTIRRAASTDTDLIDDERENLLAFLSMGQTSDDDPHNRRRLRPHRRGL